MRPATDPVTTNESSNWPPWVLDVAVGAGLFVLGAWFYGTRWIDLFPLDEFRSWLFLDRGSIHDLVRNILLMRDQQNVTSSRGVSMFVVSRSAEACDLQTQCLNGSQIFLIAASAVLLYTLVLRLLHRRTIAAVAGLLWLFSLGVVNSISWQATVHDKLAAFLVLVGLHIGLTFFRHQNRWRALIGGNAALLVVVVLAYNSKESAWVLVPSLALLSLATVRRFDWRSIAQSMALLVLPILYATYHFVRYSGSLAQNELWRRHINNGDPWENLKAYVHFLANGDPGLWNHVGIQLAVFGIVAGVAFAATAAVLKLRRGLRNHTTPSDADAPARVALWALCSMAFALAIPIRTQFHDPFYVLVPSVFLYIGLASGITMLGTPRRSNLVPRVTIALVIAAILLFNFRTSYENDYVGIPDQSANFVRALPRIGVLLPRNTDQPIYLVSDDDRPDAFRFLGTSTSRDLYQYLFDVARPNPAYEGHFIDTKRSTFNATPRDSNAYYVVFDDAMRLVEVDHGTQTLGR